MNNFGYVELKFTSDSIRQLSAIVENIVKEDQLYFSDVVPRIQGDVTDKAHLTLFYGLTDAALNNPELKTFVDSLEIESLELGELNLLEGYQGMYKVLYIELRDDTNYLKGISEKIIQFGADEDLAKREFKPHITLAYVSNNFKIPTDYRLPETNLGIESVEVRS
ncbi:MAG: hypothetical protein ABI721_00935 [Candidatus Dojkabacteria bacterium]